MAPKAEEENTAPLEKYIQKAWRNRDAVNPFRSDKKAATTPVPMLRRDCTNRIIYYIGSFNPPHLGHLALIDHVFSNTNHASSLASSTPPPAGTLNAVALFWATAEAQVPALHLHLDIDQRSKLLRDGIPEDLKRKGVWAFPEDLGEWWTFHPRLRDVCERDGFELEFVELLGPDYVLQAFPQCSGMHGVVTSNVCRKADFVVDTPEGGDLVTLGGFGPWDQLDRDEGVELPPELKHEGSQEQKATDSVWVCQKSRNLDYRIWFVQCDKPTLDPDLSSTGLRQIVEGGELDDLEDRVRGIAMSPELLVKYVKEWKSNG
ncbi:hypothetical protein SCAR479_03225 [Seiridium cardinale]|uniref:Cytidyltransferase-like domain-containing protein n=1 Tax=Seiridium cardinale TaxID=138064 RepID=A0ABR2Y234_9PEZI